MSDDQSTLLTILTINGFFAALVLPPYLRVVELFPLGKRVNDNAKLNSVDSRFMT